MKHKCLTIAGFDSSGGAGIQADLKTFSALGCYGMTVLTALPIQNTCGVKQCYDIPLDAIKAQLEAVFEDIVPDAIKVGMLFSAEIITLVSTFLREIPAHIPIIIDPVMLAKSGDHLLLPDAIQTLKTELFSLATLITPNLPEAHALVGETQDTLQLGEKLLALGPQAVLLKGGHAQHQRCNDLLITQTGAHQWLTAPRIASKNTHGTGCTLSAAICALLAQGLSLASACEHAKRYLYAALLAAKNNSVGLGYGPVHHFYHLWTDTEKLLEKL
jgi:hydroxymethylpyrimidine/phosphomethylpyrimidine kinase